MNNNKSFISEKEIKDAIEKSGYLLEQRVAPILEKKYFMQRNQAFLDSETGKSREYDINAMGAIRLYKKGYNFIFPILLCECENNAQPVVFFTEESIISFLHHYEVKVSGIPVKFLHKDGFIALSEFTGMENFHHYCKGPVATQYCSFQLKKDKSSWIAIHTDIQHDTFNTLIKVLEYEIAKHYDGWAPPKQNEKEYINIQIYYPLLILQGQLYSAKLKNNRLKLTEINHVQFRKQVSLPQKSGPEMYQIDVITEKYLPYYLKIIDTEMKKVEKVFLKKKKVVTNTINNIIEDAKKIKYKKKSLREILEF